MLRNLQSCCGSLGCSNIFLILSFLDNGMALFKVALSYGSDLFTQEMKIGQGWNSTSHTNTTYLRQLSTTYLFGISSLRRTQERIENCLYMVIPLWLG